MSGSQSSLLVSVGTPIGGLMEAHANPVSFTDGGMEFLLTGVATPYSAAYADSVAKSPKFKIFGSDAVQYGTVGTGGAGAVKYYNMSGRYVAISATGATYSANLSSWTACTVGVGTSSHVAASSGAYIAYASLANNAIQYSADGITFTAAGGTFTTCPAKTAMAFGNNLWIALSSMAGTAGEQAYIAAANPSGVWTVGAVGAINMTATKGVAYGNGVFVAVGASASAVYGKIATCTSPATGWTDRTSAAGVTFGATEAIHHIEFSGTHFVALTSNGKIIRSTDGITWSLATTAYLASCGIMTAFSDSTKIACDGAGKLVITGISGTRPHMLVSTDHGVTWTLVQYYVGKFLAAANVGAISYANSKWIINHTGIPASPLDLGALDLVTPNYIGIQESVASGSSPATPLHVRIK